MYLIKAIENHVQLYPQCSDQLMWDESGKIQRGSSWREQLKCDTCSFVSKSHNLYTELKSNKTGSNTAAINLGSQVDMKYTSMSNIGLHKKESFFHSLLKVTDCHIYLMLCSLIK